MMAGTISKFADARERTDDVLNVLLQKCGRAAAEFPESSPRNDTDGHRWSLGASPRNPRWENVLPARAPFAGRLYFGGSHSSMRLPSGSMIQPNLPYSEISVFGSTHTPSFFNSASTRFRWVTRKLNMKGFRLGRK